MQRRSERTSMPTNPVSILRASDPMGLQASRAPPSDRASDARNQANVAIDVPPLALPRELSRFDSKPASKLTDPLGATGRASEPGGLPHHSRREPADGGSAGWGLSARRASPRRARAPPRGGGRAARRRAHSDVRGRRRA